MIKHLRTLLARPRNAAGVPIGRIPIPLEANFEYNRELWNRYSHNWTKDNAHIEDKSVAADERDSYLQYLGDEWGRAADVKAIIASYIYPYINPDSVVSEIGPGGGRVASKVVDRVRTLVCFDVSEEMLRRTAVALSGYRNVEYVQLQAPAFPPQYHAMFDFIYAFDVFVHFDHHLIWRYFNAIKPLLKDDGRVFLHTTNITSPDGWKKFAKQKVSTIQGTFFTSPDIIGVFAEKAGYRVLQRSTPDASNFYLNRDFLFVMERARA